MHKDGIVRRGRDTLPIQNHLKRIAGTERRNLTQTLTEQAKRVAGLRVGARERAQFVRRHGWQRDFDSAQVDHVIRRALRRFERERCATADEIQTELQIVQPGANIHRQPQREGLRQSDIIGLPLHRILFIERFDPRFRRRVVLQIAQL